MVVLGRCEFGLLCWTLNGSWMLRTGLSTESQLAIHLTQVLQCCMHAIIVIIIVIIIVAVQLVYTPCPEVIIADI